MRLAYVLAVCAGCGNDVGSTPDAAGGGPPGSPLVEVSGPRLNESFYPSQTATVTWKATDDDTPSFTCDLDAVVGTSMIPIATAVATTSSTVKMTPWAIAGAAMGTYRVRVACTDANNLTGVGYSPSFLVSAAPQMVAYSQIQAIWTGNCTSNACHDAMVPAEGLNLTMSASYAELVNKASGQCGSLKLVEPNAPERSYILYKLTGGGSCFIGTKMPKASTSLPSAQIQLVRDWIFNGAPS